MEVRQELTETTLTSWGKRNQIITENPNSLTEEPSAEADGNGDRVGF